MLRGNYLTTLDGKGRLKIPMVFRSSILEEFGSEFYVTSMNGDFVRIYPMAEWTKIEEKLARLPSFNVTKKKFLNRTNYFGQVVQMDNQGRILIPPHLRESAQMKGDVAVLGQLTYLDVWNNERFTKDIKSNPLTAEDEKILDELGI
jgi:MraZ protein